MLKRHPVPSTRAFRGSKTLSSTIFAEAAVTPLPPVQAPSGPDAGTFVQTILTSLDDSKAEDIVSLDLHGKTTLADVMVIASGRSNVHVGAIADHLIKALKAASPSGHAGPRVEGLQNCDWVLVDAGDVIVHIFRPEVRQFYNLEKMWGGDRPGEKSSEKSSVRLAERRAR
ncbi:MAG TPA: ribosome silencing factor [Beijerinckia sp.]|jgi:ribosome-associated protein|nr:ribosome silencing factor [Beijerinckia sp.]